MTKHIFKLIKQQIPQNQNIPKTTHNRKRQILKMKNVDFWQFDFSA